MAKNSKLRPDDAYAEWFAKRLRGVLEDDDQTQVGLLKILKENNFPLNQSRLSHYMQGRRYPEPQVLAELARAIGVSADYLLGLTETRSSVASLEEMLASALGESKIDKIMAKLAQEQQRELMRYAEYLLAQTVGNGPGEVGENGTSQAAKKRAEIRATLESVERNFGIDARRQLERIGGGKTGALTAAA